VVASAFKNTGLCHPGMRRAKIRAFSISFVARSRAPAPISHAVLLSGAGKHGRSRKPSAARRLWDCGANSQFPRVPERSGGRSLCQQPLPPPDQ
jgi:hypothetical protein